MTVAEVIRHREIIWKLMRAVDPKLDRAPGKEIESEWKRLEPRILKFIDDIKVRPAILDSEEYEKNMRRIQGKVNTARCRIRKLENDIDVLARENNELRRAARKAV